MAGFRFVLVSSLALFAFACASTAGAPSIEPSTAAPPTVAIPAASTLTYATEPAGRGVTGGPEADALAAAFLQVLRARGDDEPEPDGKLATVAAWLLDETISGREPDNQSPQVIARRFGFVGPVYAGLVFPLEGPQSDLWRQAIAQLPRNLPINRYGLLLSKDGRAAGLVFGVVELTIEPFAAQAPIGRTVRLRGEIAGRFSRADVHVTGPDGAVRSTRAKGRKFDVAVELGSKGVYMVEVMGDGATGPVIVANVPVIAGTAEPVAQSRRSGAAGASQAPEVVEQQMYAMLNQARAGAGRAVLAPDPELRALALGHSRDMAAGNFVGHVSPTTGNFEDRLRRTGASLVMSGENVAQGDSAEAAHEGLMDSPGHRANMLNPKYTHVGIAVVATPGQSTPLVATLVFGRRPAVQAARLTAADVVRAVAAFRSAKKLPPLRGDPVLKAAAEAGAKAFLSGSAPTPEAALAVANQVVQQETLRRRTSRDAGCAHWVEILELDQLGQYPVFAERGLRKLDLGVATRPGDKAGPLAVLVLTEGAACGQR